MQFCAVSTSVFQSTRKVLSWCMRIAVRRMATQASTSVLAATPERQQELLINWSTVIERITKKGRNNTRLIAVSKLKPASDIKVLYDAGQRHFGENYVQELQDKAKMLPKDIKWHFIGSLQTNKCKYLSEISNLYAIETVDSVKKAEQISKHRKAASITTDTNTITPIHVFIQVNTSGEDSKSGVEPHETLELVRKIKVLDNIKVQGLMTIGSQDWDRNHNNPDFEILRELRDKINSELGMSLELSMGMSDDFEHAIDMDSNNVRVGSTIFGARPQKHST